MSTKILLLHYTNCCGGLGDRIVGLVSAIIMAKYLNRNLRIKWDYPNVKQIFKIPLLWDKSILSEKKQIVVLNMIDQKNAVKYKPQLSTWPLKKLWFHEKIIIMRCNMDVAKYIYVNPHLKTNDQKTEMSDIYKRIFKEYLIPLQPLCTNISNKRFVGVQLRTGDKYMGVGNHIQISEELHPILKKIATYVYAHLGGIKIIFFSSDNMLAFPIFKKIFHNIDNGLAIHSNNKGTGIHFEKSKVPAADLNALLNDFKMLTRANKLFISEYSNYGRLAVLMNENVSANYFGFDNISFDVHPIDDISTLFSK